MKAVKGARSFSFFEDGLFGDSPTSEDMGFYSPERQCLYSAHKEDVFNLSESHSSQKVNRRLLFISPNKKTKLTTHDNFLIPEPPGEISTQCFSSAHISSSNSEKITIEDQMISHKTTGSNLSISAFNIKGEVISTCLSGPPQKRYISTNFICTSFFLKKKVFCIFDASPKCASIKINFLQ